MSKINPPQKISTEELMKRAEKGDVEAQSALGLLFELGIDVPKADAKESAKWWGLAAKSGDAYAQFSLAELISTEFDDTDENRAMAQALYSKAESHGHVCTDKALRLFEQEQGQTWRILVVDKSLEVRQSVKKFAESEGCTVLEAQDTNEAMAILRKSADVKLVITDVKMGNTNGFEMISSMRASEKLTHIPVVIMTNSSSADLVLQGKKAGVFGWIVKPPKLQTIRKYLYKVDSMNRRSKNK